MGIPRETGKVYSGHKGEKSDMKRRHGVELDFTNL